MIYQESIWNTHIGNVYELLNTRSFCELFEFTDCKEIKPSILKEVSPEYSMEGLKLQYFGHLM